MKKLMCLLLLTTLIAGCSSNDSKSKANVEGKVAENQTTNDTKKDDKKNEEEDQKDSEKEDKEESKENTDTDSSNTTSQSSNKKSSDTSSQTSDKKEQSSSSNSSNGNSQSTPSQKPSQPEPTPEPTPTPTPVPDTPTEQRAKADGVMAQINTYRQQNGLTPFIVDSYLVKSASDHAYAMAEARALWHSGAAECITNYDDPFSAWKNSPPHNDMLLNNNRYGAVGIYYVDGYYFSVFQTSP